MYFSIDLSLSACMKWSRQLASEHGTGGAMTRYVEATYTDWIGRQVFRELMAESRIGLPTAVRQRDGNVYRLVAVSGRRAVYQECAFQGEWRTPADHPALTVPCRPNPAN
jgi:hypothetical protein